jgi:hypothetical protein
VPEQITKYPEVTLQILKGAGARCGEGVEQKILTKCPPKQFCSLPTGELCVYGIEEIPQMTQLSAREIASVVCPGDQKPAGETIRPSLTLGLLIVVVFAIGLAAGAIWRKSGHNPK